MATTVIKSVKPAGGGDYTTLNAWAAANSGDLKAADQIRVAEVYGGGNAATGNLDFHQTPWPTDANRYVVIRAAAGEEHKGIYNENKAYMSVSADKAITTLGVFMRLTDMLIVTNGGTALSAVVATDNRFTAMTVIIDRCIIIRRSSGWSNSAVACAAGANGSITIRNSVLLYNGAAANRYSNVIASQGASISAYNCLLITTGAGDVVMSIVEGANGATLTTQNCYLAKSQAAVTIYGTGASAGANDATSNTEATSASLDNIAYSTVNFINVTAGSEDFHLQPGSVLVDTGADLSGSFTDDIDNDERTVPYSIGADQPATVLGSFFTFLSNLW